MTALSKIFTDEISRFLEPLLDDEVARQVWHTAPCFSTIRLNCLSNQDVQSIKNNIDDNLKQQFEKRGKSPPQSFLHPALKDTLVIIHLKDVQPIEELSKQIVVDALCGAAVLRGAHVFTNGIMAAPSDLARGDQVSVFADLQGSCKQGLMVPYTGVSMHVANGIAAFSRREIFSGAEKPTGIGVHITSCRGSDGPSLNELDPILGFLQNLPSIVVGHVLGPRSGERVLDMCAAPGGKTSHIAALMDNKGTVVALDKTEAKVEKILHNCRSMGVECVQPYAIDATKACSDLVKDTSCVHPPPYPPSSFDRVLLDAPCSALGNRPCLRNTTGLKQLNSYPRLQRRLLRSAEQLVRPGGTLVYSTCTICPEENELAVEWVLEHLPSLQLVKQEPHIGGHGRVLGSLSRDQADMLQFWFPFDGQIDTCDTDCIGFFIAKFVKKK